LAYGLIGGSKIMSEQQKESKSDQRQFWQMVLETFKSSGLSVRQFCKQEGLTEPSFYSWRKRLAANESEQRIKIIPEPSSFIEVSIPKDNSALLELVLSSGNTLRIGSGTDSKTLTRTLSALREANLC
jgi:transposase